MSKERMTSLLLLVVTAGALGENQCKDMLQGYLTGQLTSALGTLQVDALRKEVIIQIQNTEATLNDNITKLKADLSNVPQGLFATSYIRWGKKTCPDGATLVYTGFTAGDFYTNPGGGGETICLPSDPEWNKYSDGNDNGRTYIYGTEYEFYNFQDPALRRLHNHDVPCALCKKSGKVTTQMIPGRKSCYLGWTKEYSGYLVSQHYSQKANSGYKCVDESPDTLHGGHAYKGGNLFYPVEARCGSLKCPPYVEGRELTCVVCTI